MNEHVRNFKTIFNNTAKHNNRYDVFRDFVFLTSIAIENAFLKCNEKEEEYLNIIGKYSSDDANRFATLYAELVMAFELETSDVLGQIFMELEISSKNLSQYFTPYSLCKVMASVNIGSGFDDKLSERGYITVSEPASGSGSMIIAFSECMLEEGYNPQRQMYFQAIDLDPVAARMAYIQLSTLGLVGEVVIGNTLSLEFTSTMKTPAYYLWGHTLKRSSHFVESDAKKIETDVEISEDEPFCLQLNLFANCEHAKLVSQKLSIQPS